MKNRKDPSNRQSTDDMNGNWKTNFPQSRQSKQVFYDKSQSKKIKYQNQMTQNQNVKPKRFYTLENQYNEAPKSMKNEETKRITNQRYFKKDRSEEKKNLTEIPSDGKESKNQFENEKQKWKNQTANAEYLKLHDKLNNIEKKISEMKKNLQKKKQDKIKKQKEKQERQNRNKETEMSDQGGAKKPNLKNLVTQVPEHREVHGYNKNPYSPRHNIYYVSEIVRLFKDRQSLARQHLQTSLQIMAYFQHTQRPSDAEFVERKLNLQKMKGYENKKTVIFDLDETLIHCNENLNTPFDVKLPIVFPTGEVIEAGINIRPYAKEILQKLSQNFQIIVFTASHSCYANVVIDYLDPQKKYVHHRLFREHCYATPQGMHIKDLRVLNRDFSNMVLVDNAAYSYLHQPDNGIPIIPYYRGSQDFELKALQTYLDSMLLVKDMRTVNRRTFKLHEYKKYYQDLQKLVEDLYIVEHNL